MSGHLARNTEARNFSLSDTGESLDMLFGPLNRCPSGDEVDTSPRWLSALIERRHILRGLLILIALLLLPALIYRRMIPPPPTLHYWRN